jgi:acetolactate synthase I/II/III large subunit
MPYTASTAFLEALLEGGIKYIYGNFGSDHPAILESLAEAKKTGRKMPEVLTVPIEQVGLHIAMGYAHVYRQAVIELIVGYWKTAMCHGSCRG